MSRVSALAASEVPLEALPAAGEGAEGAGAELAAFAGGAGISAALAAGAPPAAADDSMDGRVFEEDDAAWLPPHDALEESTKASTATARASLATDSFGSRMASSLQSFLANRNPGRPMSI